MPCRRAAARRAFADTAERPDTEPRDTRRDKSEVRRQAAARNHLDIAPASETAASPASERRGTAARPGIAVPPDIGARQGTAEPQGMLRFRTGLEGILAEPRPEDRASSGTARLPVALADIAASSRAWVAPASAGTAPDIAVRESADQHRAERLPAETHPEAAQEGARPAIYPAGPARGADLVPPCDTLPSARRGATPPRLPHPHHTRVANMQSPKFLAAFSPAVPRFKSTRSWSMRQGNSWPRLIL